MSIRKGYLYALLLAIGLLMWTTVGERLQHPSSEPPPQVTVEEAAVTPWTSSDALYACSMKAQELGLTVESLYTTADVLQGSLALSGSREALQNFYGWLETEGCFREIRSFQLQTDDEAASRLSLSFQL